MKTEYHTTNADLQSTIAHRQLPKEWPTTARAAQAANSRRHPLTFPPAALRLVGDREMLRQLRAAEMAAWEAVPPKTALAEDQAPDNALKPKPAAVRPGIPSDRLELTAWLVLFLAGCGTVAISLDLPDFSLLLTAWSQLVGSLRSLLA